MTKPVANSCRGIARRGETLWRARGVDRIDLQIMPGETVCILGPSGSGKITLLRCINWLETA